jgi:predicted porin
MLNRSTLKPAADVFKRITQTSFALACLSTAGAGWAQSSVTIYGIVDTYVGSVKDSRGTVSVLQEGGHTAGFSRQRRSGRRSERLLRT